MRIPEADLSSVGLIDEYLSTTWIIKFKEFSSEERKILRISIPSSSSDECANSWRGLNLPFLIHTLRLVTSEISKPVLIFQCITYLLANRPLFQNESNPMPSFVVVEDSERMKLLFHAQRGYCSNGIRNIKYAQDPFMELSNRSLPLNFSHRWRKWKGPLKFKCLKSWRKKRLFM